MLIIQTMQFHVSNFISFINDSLIWSYLNDHHSLLFSLRRFFSLFNFNWSCSNLSWFCYIICSWCCCRCCIVFSWCRCRCFCFCFYLFSLICSIFIRASTIVWLLIHLIDWDDFFLSLFTFTTIRQRRVMMMMMKRRTRDCDCDCDCCCRCCCDWEREFRESEKNDEKDESKKIAAR